MDFIAVKIVSYFLIYSLIFILVYTILKKYSSEPCHIYLITKTAVYLGSILGIFFLFLDYAGDIEKSQSLILFCQYLKLCLKVTGIVFAVSFMASFFHFLAEDC